MSQLNKSDLIFKDSLLIINDFAKFGVSKNLDSMVSNLSIVQSNQRYIVYNGDAYIKGKKLNNLFDSVCRDFAINHIIKYKWVEPLSRNKIYLVSVYYIYNLSSKSFNISIEEDFDDTKSIPVFTGFGKLERQQ